MSRPYPANCPLSFSTITSPDSDNASAVTVWPVQVRRTEEASTAREEIPDLVVMSADSSSREPPRWANSPEASA